MSAVFELSYLKKKKLHLTTLLRAHLQMSAAFELSYLKKKNYILLYYYVHTCRCPRYLSLANLS